MIFRKMRRKFPVVPTHPCSTLLVKLFPVETYTKYPQQLRDTKINTSLIEFSVSIFILSEIQVIFASHDIITDTRIFPPCFRKKIPKTPRNATLFLKIAVDAPWQHS